MSDKCGRCGMSMNHEIHQGVFGEFHDFDYVSKEIRELVQRGNVTSEELKTIRCNSWEWEALVPAMTDEAFVERMQYALDNCFTRRERPFTTYNQAVEGLWAPELLKRFEELRASEDIDVNDIANSRQQDDYEPAQGGFGDLGSPPAMAGDAVALRDISTAWVAGGGYQPRPITFSYDDVVQILKNLGIDAECHACAVIAFTGIGLPGDRHTCKKTPPAIAGDALLTLESTAGVVGGDYERNSDGRINNCALANNDEEKNCQVCSGRCPDREAFAMAKTIASTDGVYESTLTEHVFPELFSEKK